jgi:MerR family transcriptional regulator, thiopeptide resistance regulator
MVDRVKGRNSQNWSTAQVARMSKVTSRTLRHYDEIGLLRPAQVAGNGMRFYEREQLLRLQQILVLRDLGLSLEAISTIVNEGGDRVDQLRRHHRWLTEERERYDRLAHTVAAAIRELEGGEAVRTDELFDNFDADRQTRYEAELVERYGDDVRPSIEQSKRNMAGWSKADAARIQGEWTSFAPRLVELIDAGAAAHDQRGPGDHRRALPLGVRLLDAQPGVLPGTGQPVRGLARVPDAVRRGSPAPRGVPA